MVRHQPHSTFRPTHSICPWGIPRKDRYPSHCNCFTLQPPHGSTSTIADQQASKTTMDTRWDTLKRSRWTHPQITANRTSSLAHRKWCTVKVFWLLKTVLIIKVIVLHLLMKFGHNFAHTRNIIDVTASLTVITKGRFQDASSSGWITGASV